MRNRGFTLVELLVVITIIGILVSLAVPNYNRIRAKAKESQAVAGGHAIVQGLEAFAQAHNGFYPGVALPNADRSGPQGWGTDQIFFAGAAGVGTFDLYSMRGIIGGGPVEPGKATLLYMDNFYFEPKADGSAPRNLPDRLIADGAIDGYPQNPFIQNIPGVTDQGRPMLNLFGIEHEDDFTAGGVLITQPDAIFRILNISMPNVQNLGAGAYGFPDPAADSWPPMGSPFGAMQSVNGTGNIRFDRDNNFRVDRAEINTSFVFPEGDFAFIPLDPIQRNPSSPDFMRFCKNYWLVIYGSRDGALSNKYENVLPNFKPPLGDGRPTLSTGNLVADVENLSPYEYMAKRALVGATKVYASAYEDQLNVSADQ